MTISFIIGETQRENLKDGDYIAVIKNLEEKMDKFGSYFEIEVSILEPNEYSGRVETERFYVGSDDEKKRKMAKWQFSLLCKQLTSLKTGEAITGDKLLNKKFKMTVKNNMSENGKVYQNTVNRVLIESQEYLPEQNKPLNDDVPF
jgi:hypothetical protein